MTQSKNILKTSENTHWRLECGGKWKKILIFLLMFSLFPSHFISLSLFISFFPLSFLFLFLLLSHIESRLALLELQLLLPLPQIWDSRCAQSHNNYIALGMGPGASCMPGKHPPTELCPHAPCVFFQFISIPAP